MERRLILRLFAPTWLELFTSNPKICISQKKRNLWIRSDQVDVHLRRDISQRGWLIMVVSYATLHDRWRLTRERYRRPSSQERHDGRRGASGEQYLCPRRTPKYPWLTVGIQGAVLCRYAIRLRGPFYDGAWHSGRYLPGLPRWRESNLATRRLSETGIKSTYLTPLGKR